MGAGCKLKNKSYFMSKTVSGRLVPLLQYRHLQLLSFAITKYETHLKQLQQNWKQLAIFSWWEISNDMDAIEKDSHLLTNHSSIKRCKKIRVKCFASLYFFSILFIFAQLSYRRSARITSLLPTREVWVTCRVQISA